MNHRSLEVFTIYDKPKDYPDKIVIRRCEIDSKGQQIPREIMFYQTVEDARNRIPPGLVLFYRHPEDDPTIVETWL